MPLFDERVPQELLHVQKWFGTIITSPLQADDCISPVSPTGQPIQLESAKYIVPSPTLEPHLRMQIYNQQYWWRLLSILQDAYPSVLRLFGVHDFNDSIAIPYLTKHRPSHWSLNTLGDFLPQWIKEHYKLDDMQLVYDAALLDEMVFKLFFKAQYPPLLAEDGDLSVKRLYLQPYVDLISFPYQLLEFRKNLLKETVEYWLDHPFPELKKISEFILFYRTPKGMILHKVISQEEWSILQLFQEGASIDAVCEWIEKQSSEFRNVAEENLQQWFGEWTLTGLFCSHD